MGEVIPLSDAGSGRYTVVSLEGGHGFLKKVSEMGIYPGSEIEVLGDSAEGGPVRILVKGSQIGMGRGMALRIFVRKRG